jgi:hypothetical protein
MKWFSREEHHNRLQLGVGYMHEKKKACTLLTFSHLFHIRHFCLRLQSQKNVEVRFLLTQLSVHHNYYAITAASHNTHNKQFTFFQAPNTKGIFVPRNEK